VRDAIVAVPHPELHVLAPCVHDAPCPALTEPDAWCHEDIGVDLPASLVPVAKAAGLRWQGLTFSYLVLSRDVRQSCTRAADATTYRVVSSPIATKGKRELHLCGSFEGLAAPAWRKVMRLDRHASPGNEVWGRAARGDLLAIAPSVSAARPRVDGMARIERAGLPDRFG
jgi:ribosomal protein RSM22 (predicted rRNA methylase)